jgi:hypothetical protein
MSADPVAAPNILEKKLSLAPLIFINCSTACSRDYPAKNSHLRQIQTEQNDKPWMSDFPSLAGN